MGKRSRLGSFGATAALVALALCGCQGTAPLVDGPELTFEGTVTDLANAGVEASVIVTHYDDCWEVLVRADTGRSDATGAYEVQHPSLTGLDGCFVVRAEQVDSSGLQPDSAVLFNQDLHDRGDPLGSGVITVHLRLGGEAHAR